ncbi:hypothetical protein SAMN02745126_05118 [Enhydrobacter aerosaccus]|uniref:Uncharacterized protein n=1 Tax=Enhydrobacter aerosaccus TaxID=225324 RepID=A0A1T4SUG4_9HYPH|nr:hypothetical protein [Enhydrobacter aerosaccus]SKA31799.1 hypothetical protein SAMN02745126_05118 [Enhydrobacter aerosaccus]
MNKILPLSLAVLFGLPAYAQVPSTLDGTWRGRSDGGSCNAPLDYVITIEDGFVDGSAFDTTAKGPVPNLTKAPPPPPGPGLWQLHGVVKAGSFSLLAVASTRGENQRRDKVAVTVQGNTLVVTERGGCGRTARLSRN